MATTYSDGKSQNFGALTSDRLANHALRGEHPIIDAKHEALKADHEATKSRVAALESNAPAADGAPDDAGADLDAGH